MSRLSYSALTAYARCGYRFYAERVLGLPPDPVAAGPAATATAGRRNAAERGVLIHALLQSLSFRRPVAPGPEAVRAAAARAGLDPLLTEEETGGLIAIVTAFAASDLCARLGHATAPRREERFAFGLTEGVLMTGAVDVVAREPGGRLLIVDYKSDRLGGSDPAVITDRAYPTQRAVYALAGLHAGATAVEVVHCFLERPEAPAQAVYGPDDRPELEAALHRLAGGVLAGDFPVTDTPHRGICAGCPAEGGLCSWPLEVTRRVALDRLF